MIRVQLTPALDTDWRSFGFKRKLLPSISSSSPLDTNTFSSSIHNLIIGHDHTAATWSIFSSSFASNTRVLRNLRPSFPGLSAPIISACSRNEEIVDPGVSSTVKCFHHFTSSVLDHRLRGTISMKGRWGISNCTD